MTQTPQIGSLALDGQTIRWECQRRGWNQEALARHSGLSRPTISVAYRGGTITGRTARLIQYAFEQTKPTLDNILMRRVG